MLVTTLTKKMSEDLTDYLLEMGFKVRYLHSEIDTLERIQIIRELRLGEYDVLVGVNLLREGLDLPEVSLVGDPRRRQGGLPARRDVADPDDRPRGAQRRAARCSCTPTSRPTAMRKAIDETDRRRAIQVQYNLDHGITAETIVKGISDITEFLMGEGKVPKSRRRRREKRVDMEPHEIEQTIVELEEEMLAAAEELRFEYAAKLRDEIRELRRELDEATAAGRVNVSLRPVVEADLEAFYEQQADPGVGARSPRSRRASASRTSRTGAGRWPTRSRRSRARSTSTARSPGTS